MDITSIKDPNFVKQLNKNELNLLSYDIRQFLLKNVSQTGGHLSSNLGIVELTIALHYVFNSPTDKFLFDVGHQSYVHKILTGRADQFINLRQFNGLSGFQKRHESIHDVWEAGHSSTAISAATGMAVSRDLSKEKGEVIAIVGDASIANGESFEGLNYLGDIDNKVIIILNDNNMSISKNVGGFSNFLSEVRISNTYSSTKHAYTSLLGKSTIGKKVYHTTKELKDRIKTSVMDDNMFSQFGLDYIGPIDGHDFDDLIKALHYAKDLKNSVVVHVKTTKGKGYVFAENDKEGIYHGVGKFNVETGILPNPNVNNFAKTIADTVSDIMDQDEDVVCITPAMKTGSYMQTLFSKHPNRSFDVGITEEHAMTFAAGLSASGKKPYINIYSSFIQRCYDQINHDIARMNLPILIGIDHSGLVGEDGETHHGVFDTGLFMPVPNLVIMCPCNSYETKQMVNTVFNHFDKPYMIKFPKSSLVDQPYDQKELEIGSWKVLNLNKTHDIAVITYGDSVEKVLQLCVDNNYPVDVINARFFKPMDTKVLAAYENKKLLVYETDLKNGGLGQYIVNYYHDNHKNVDITTMGIGDHYTPQGDMDSLLKLENISLDDFKEKIEEML